MLNLDNKSEISQEPEKKCLHEDGYEKGYVEPVQFNGDLKDALLTVSEVTPAK